ncbi:MAG: GAF domain-containing sensor histidine kinase [Deltaproteobacteria bacterium]|nr:GAF domain-containing sensor histidine kinase [Deltaproteobacteria bacterium]
MNFLVAGCAAWRDAVLKVLDTGRVHARCVESLLDAVPTGTDAPVHAVVLRVDAAAGAAPALRWLEAARAANADLDIVLGVPELDPPLALWCVQAGVLAVIPGDAAEPALSPALTRAMARHEQRMSAGPNALATLLASVGAAELHRRILETALRYLAADDGCLMLPTLGDDRLYVAHSVRCSPGARDDNFTQLGQRIAGRAALERRTVLVNDGRLGATSLAGLDPDAATLGALNGRMRSALVVPLVHQDELRGVLCLNRIRVESEFGDEDLRRAELLAAEAALALDTQDIRERVWAADKYVTVGQMAAGVAHDVNNPISYVLNNVQYALAQLGRPAANLDEIRSALRDAESGAGKVRDIVRDLHALARMNLDEPDALLPLDVAVQSAVRIAAGTLRSKARVKVEVPNDLEVRGTAGDLVQVLVNLLANAGEAMDGNAAGQITIRGMQRGSSVVVEVKDNGRGIPEALVSRVFSPFFTTKPVSQGLGLGLAVSRNIIKKHGGRMTLRSTAGSGTLVTIELPAAGVDTRTAILAAG